MEKIQFTPEQKAVVEKFNNGNYSPFFASEDEQRAFNEVVEMAEARLDNYPEDYDFGNDLMVWIWNEYQTQEANA